VKAYASNSLSAGNVRLLVCLAIGVQGCNLEFCKKNTCLYVPHGTTGRTGCIAPGRVALDLSDKDTPSQAAAHHAVADVVNAATNAKLS
jgi:hypothetical protein